MNVLTVRDWFSEKELVWEKQLPTMRRLVPDPLPVVDLPHTCFTCAGYGSCAGCDGEGRWEENCECLHCNHGMHEISCHRCNGTGKCAACKGKGMVEWEEDPSPADIMRDCKPLPFVGGISNEIS